MRLSSALSTPLQPPGLPSRLVQVLDQSRSPKGGLVVKSVSGNAAKARKYAALRQPASCVRVGLFAVVCRPQ